MTEEHIVIKNLTWALDSVSLDHLLHRKFITGHFFPSKDPMCHHCNCLPTIWFSPPYRPTTPLFFSYLFSRTFPTFQQPKYLILLHSVGTLVHSGKKYVSSWKARVIYLTYHIVYFSSFKIYIPELSDVQWLLTVTSYFFSQWCPTQ